MPYCPRCGVEIEDRLEECPLCETPIPSNVREETREPLPYPQDIVPPRKMYKSLTPRQLRWFVLSLITLVGLVPILITVMIDRLNNGFISWSYYVIIPLVFVTWVVYLFLRFPRKPFISVNGTLIGLILLNAFIESRSNPLAFFTSPGFLFYLLGFLLAESILVFIISGKRKWFDIVAFSHLIVALFLMCLDYFISGKTGWSLVTLSCMLPVAVYFGYVGRAKNKGLNLVGFFFVLLTLMLLGIDFSTGFSGWSIITSVIHLFIGLVFYIMHIVFFNDTDWRKALHL